MSDNRLRVGVVEAQNPTARELIHRLLIHPRVEVTALQASEPHGADLGEVFGDLRDVRSLPPLSPIDVSALTSACDVAFLCLPHGKALDLVPPLADKGVRVFDLSSDFRFRDREAYRRAFDRVHPHPDHNRRAVYGLPEVYRPQLPAAAIISMPGTWPTAVILALAPLMKRDVIEPGSIIADCKGGLSSTDSLPLAEAHPADFLTNLGPYFPRQRYQKPEIEEQLSRLSGQRQDVTYVPHYMPAVRGSLVTCYAILQEEMTEATLVDLYTGFYGTEPYVRIRGRGGLPSTNDVAQTNFCDIGLRVDGAQRLVVFAALDQLFKGSAGQAVQCFNIVHGFEESMGLPAPRKAHQPA